MPFGGALVTGLIGGGTSIVSGILGGKAAKSAAQAEQKAAGQVVANTTQAAATATGDVNAAAGTAIGDVNAATGDANQTLTAAQQQQLTALQPYIAAGTGALNPLTSDVASLTSAGNQFQFTPADYQNDPGYAFQVQQAQQALARSAAAGGGVLGGGALKATARLSNNLANTQLNSAFSRALESYTTNRQNLLSQISGYQNLVGTGLSSTNSGNQIIGQTANQVAANKLQAGLYSGNTNLTAGTYAGNTTLGANQTIAQALEGGANAQAAGDIGAANSYSAALGGVANAANRGYIYSQYGGTGNGPLNQGPGGYATVGNTIIPLGSGGAASPSPYTGVTTNPDGSLTVNR